MAQLSNPLFNLLVVEQVVPSGLVRKEKGASLIEVLVAVVILSIGILGIAGIQIVSLQQNRGALLRLEALQLANDIIDRMRANPNQMYTQVLYADLPPNSPDCVISSCSPPQMKNYDIAQWKCAINSLDLGGQIMSQCTKYAFANRLPNGSGAILNQTSNSVCDVNAGEICVAIRWRVAGSDNFDTVLLRTGEN